MTDKPDFVAQFILPDQGVYGFRVNGVWLAGMPIPGNDDALWTGLAGAGITRIVCLTHDSPPYEARGAEILMSRKLLDHFDDVDPAELEGESRRIGEIAAAIVPELKKGEGVAVHCKGGTGRTGTLIGAVLREMGYPGEAVMRALSGANDLRGKSPGGWPESEWQRQLISKWPPA